MQCEGRCSTDGDCKGEVRKVRVIGPAGADWGTFAYCDVAVMADRDNGYYVEEEDE